MLDVSGGMVEEPNLIGKGKMKGKERGRMLVVLLSVWLLFVSGCSVGESEYLADDLSGVNHTSEAINYFSVNGYGGGNIQPHGFGGGACCMLMPRKWRPGLKIFVKWETDPNPRARLPALGTASYDAAYAEHEKNYRQHGAVVEIPKYETSELCSITIHFLPCNSLKATTVCQGYRHPDYPIKEALVMKEPNTCLK
jgi:hypothetical protein